MLGCLRLEFARLGFILLWLGLFQFCLFPYLKKCGEKNRRGKNSRRKELAGIRPSAEKT